MKKSGLPSLLAIGLALCLVSATAARSQAVFSRAERLLQATTTKATFTTNGEIQKQCGDLEEFIARFDLSTEKRKELRGTISKEYEESVSLWENNTFTKPNSQWFDDSKKDDIVKKSKYFVGGIAMNVVVWFILFVQLVCVFINLFRKQQLFDSWITKVQQNKWIRHTVFALNIVCLISLAAWVYLWIANTDYSIIDERIQRADCAVEAMYHQILNYQQASPGNGDSNAGLEKLKEYSSEITKAMDSMAGPISKTNQMRSSDLLNRWEVTAAAYPDFKSSYTADSKTYQGSITATAQVKSTYLINLKKIIETELPDEISYYQFISSRIWNSSLLLEDFDTPKQSAVKQVFATLADNSEKVRVFVQTMYEQFFQIEDYLQVTAMLKTHFVNFVVCVLTLCGWQFFVLLVTGYFDNCRVWLTHCAKLNLAGFGAMVLICTLLIKNVTFATSGAFYGCSVIDRLMTQKGAFNSIFKSYTSEAETIGTFFDTCVLEAGESDLLKSWTNGSSQAEITSFSQIMEGIESYTTVLPKVSEYLEYTVGGGIDRNLTYHSKFKLLDKGIPANEDYREAMERFNTYRCALEVMNYNTSMCIYTTRISFSTDDDQYDKRIGREYCMAYGSMPFTHCYANRYKNRDVTCLNGTPEEAGPFITSGCKSAKSFSEMMAMVRADPAMDAYLTKNGWAFKAFTDSNFKSAYESLTSLYPQTSAYLSKSQSKLVNSFKCSQIKSAFRALENTVCFRTAPMIQDQVSRMQILMIIGTITAFFTFLSERLVVTSFDDLFGHEKDQFKKLSESKNFQRVPQQEPDVGIEMQDVPPSEDLEKEKLQSPLNSKGRGSHRVMQLDLRMPETTNQQDHASYQANIAQNRLDSFNDVRIPGPEKANNPDAVENRPDSFYDARIPGYERANQSQQLPQQLNADQNRPDSFYDLRIPAPEK